MDSPSFDELFDMHISNCGIRYDDLEPVQQLKSAIRSVSEDFSNCPVLIRQGEFALDAVI